MCARYRRVFFLKTKVEGEDIGPNGPIFLASCRTTMKGEMKLSEAEGRSEL